MRFRFLLALRETKGLSEPIIDTPTELEISMRHDLYRFHGMDKLLPGGPICLTKTACGNKSDAGVTL